MKLLSSIQTKERRTFRFSMEGYQDCNALEIDIYYTKGGYNWYNGRNDRRGYWVSFQPCSVSQYTVTQVPTDGVKQFLLEVGRQSQKKFDEAVKMVSKQTIENIVEYKQFPLNDEDIAFILQTIQED